MNKIFSVKKLLALLTALVMTMAFVPAAFAASITIVSCEAGDNVINVTVSIDGVSAATHVLAIVTEHGTTASYENAIAIQYGQYSGSDTLVLPVHMKSDAVTDTYTVTVGAPGAGTASTEIDYLGTRERNGIIENINQDVPDVDVLISAFDSSPIAVGYIAEDREYYTLLSDDAKREFFGYIIENRKYSAGGVFDLSFKDIGDLAGEAFVITYANNPTLDRKALEKGFKEILPGETALGNVPSSALYKKLSDYKSFFTVLRAQPGYAPSIQGIKESLETAVTLERINEVGYMELADEIIAQKRVLQFEAVEEDTGVSLRDLRTVAADTTNTSYFGKAMKAELPVNTLEEFYDALKKGYEKGERDYDKYLANKDKDDNKGSGSSGSGSKGSGSRGDNSGQYVIDQQTVRPDPLGKKKMIGDYYTDMVGFDWAEKAVLSLTEEGIVDGTGNMTFSPEKLLTREEFMKLLVNTFNLVDARAVCTFSDVTDTNAWYYIYVASAQKAGITNGRGDGTFGLGDYVTREEMATLVYRAALNSGITFGTAGRDVVTYGDVGALSDFARDAVMALTAYGVMSGSDGYFSPQNSASRAQAAVVIYNINNLKGSN